MKHLRINNESLFQNLNALDFLKSESNLIEEITFNDFHGLTNLALLNLKPNCIKKIESKSFESTSSMIKINFQFNNLSSLDLDFVKASEIDLLNNPITEVKKKVFYKLRLKLLKLPINNISNENICNLIQLFNEFWYRL